MIMMVTFHVYFCGASVRNGYVLFVRCFYWIFLFYDWICLQLCIGIVVQSDYCPLSKFLIIIKTFSIITFFNSYWVGCK